MRAHASRDRFSSDLESERLASIWRVWSTRTFRADKPPQRAQQIDEASMRSNGLLATSLPTLGTLTLAAPAFGQTQGYDPFRRETASAVSAKPHAEEVRARRRAQIDSDLHFRSRTDSLEWARAKALADRSTGFRIIVSLKAHHVWVVAEEDTLLSAPAATAKGTTLDYSGREFNFNTPRGRRTVLNKDADPIWQPPDWLYIETAKEHGFRVDFIPDKGSIPAQDGWKLTVRNNRVGAIDADGYADFPTNLHIIIGNTLYIPPMGTDNRRVSGTLGKHKLNLDEGYILHGTPDQNSIGRAGTPGCVRPPAEAIGWWTESGPVGTRAAMSRC